MSLDRNRFARRSGTGGSPEPHEIWTNGKKRLEVSGEQPSVQMDAVTATPPAPGPHGSGSFFFQRNADGKGQFCIVFPSGAVQILATGP